MIFLSVQFLLEGVKELGARPNATLRSRQEIVVVGLAALPSMDRTRQLFSLFLFLVFSCRRIDASSLDGLQFRGQATPNSDDAVLELERRGCGIRTVAAPVERRMVSISRAQFRQGESCGRCVEVQCTDATKCLRATKIRTMVVDVCEHCPYGWMEMDPWMWYAVAGVSRSSQDPWTSFGIQWSFVQCDTDMIPGYIRLRFHKQSWRRWLALYVENASEPVAQVVFILSNGSRIKLTRQPGNLHTVSFDGNQFDISKPFKVQITSTEGNQLNYSFPSYPKNLEGIDIQTQLQFWPVPSPGVAEPVEETAVLPRVLDQRNATKFPVRFPVGSGGDVGNGIYNLWSNGYIEGPMLFGTISDLLLEMRVEKARSGNPIVNISIDGQWRQSIVVESTQWVVFSIGLTLTPGNHSVRIEFTNDAWRPVDRNLLVRRVLTQTTESSVTETVESSGEDMVTQIHDNPLSLVLGPQFETRTSGFPSEGGALASTWVLDRNGYIETPMRFGPLSLLYVELAAVYREGWPVLSVSVDGDAAQRHSITVDQENFTLYELEIPDQEGLRMVRLELINELWSLSQSSGKNRSVLIRQVATVAPESGVLYKQSMTVAASDFRYRPVRGLTNMDGTFAFLGTGRIMHQFDFGQSGLVTLSAELQSNFVEGQWGIARFFVNGSLVSVTFVSSATMKTFSSKIRDRKGLGWLAVEFANGLFDDNAGSAQLDSGYASGYRALWVRNVMVSST